MAGGKTVCAPSPVGLLRPDAHGDPWSDISTPILRLPSVPSLVDADGGGVYTNGHLLFIRQAKVLAQMLDAGSLALTGSPFQIAEGVFGRQGGQFLSLSASAGAFAFRAGEARFGRQFTWVDRSGAQIATVGDRLGDPDGISWSPDRSQLVFFERGATSSQVWMLDMNGNLVHTATFP